MNETIDHTGELDRDERAYALEVKRLRLKAKALWDAHCRKSKNTKLVM